MAAKFSVGVTATTSSRSLRSAGRTRFQSASECLDYLGTAAYQPESASGIRAHIQLGEFTYSYKLSSAATSTIRCLYIAFDKKMSFTS